jgi:hypothetical protein
MAQKVLGANASLVGDETTRTDFHGSVFGECVLKYLRFVPVCMFALALLAGCGGDGFDSDGTSAASSASTTSTGSSSGSSTGSGTTTTNPPAANGTATLRWSEPTSNTNGTPLTDLAGYRIYYGTDAKNLDGTIALNGAQDTSYKMSLATGTWYFAIKSVTENGAESAMSDVVPFTIS